MRTETIKEEKIAEVKALTEGMFSKAESTDETVILRADVDKETYCKIADIDLKTVSMLGNVYGILEYFENGGQFTLKCETYLNTEEEDYMEERLSVEYAHTYDFLDLFKKEEDTDVTSPDVQKKYVQHYLEDNKDDIADKLYDDFPEVYAELKEQIIESLEHDDVGDCLAEEIADNWIRVNSEEAFDKALNEISSYDLKDKIKEAIDSL